MRAAMHAGADAFEPMFAPRAGARRPAEASVYGPEDLEAARAAGRAEGRAEALADIAAREAEALRAIAMQMRLFLNRLAGEAESLRGEAVHLSLDAAKALSGALLDRFAEDAVLDFVTGAVGGLRHAPRLVMRVAPDLADALGARLVETARDCGFPGEVVVRGDPAAAPGDCHLDWGEAQVGRSRAEIAAKLEASAAAWLDSVRGFALDLDVETPEART